MSTRQDSAASPFIETTDELVAWMAAGCKPIDRWLIGTEHEKFLFQTSNHAPVPYEGAHGVKAIFEMMMRDYGWEAIREGETIIALKRPNAEAQGRILGNISLEPGGQFELSGAAVGTLHDVNAETVEHLDQLRAIGRKLGVGMMGLGFSPVWRLDETPVMPKRRYAVMTRYMPQVGTRGLDMMYRTATIQVNLDFASEADMVKKLRVSLALQPIASALFAASPFVEGQPSGFKTMRSEVWRDTDKRRTGNLPFVFEPGMGFERYADHALDVPMYFVYRDGQYIDVAGASFRDFLAGKLIALPGERPTIDDWSDHLTTLFPDVRMKRFLEMRGADCGPAPHITALSAFWVGLLYDGASLDAALGLVKSWSQSDRDALRDAVPKQTMSATIKGRSVSAVAQDALVISRAGLKRRARMDQNGRDETTYLDPLDALMSRGETVADQMLARFNGPWSGAIDHIFTDYRF
jgi:glutamate--cysteine ligase